MPRNSRLTSLHLEHLEDRCVPAVFGNPWADPEHLTLSFAPDNTSVNGYSSQLFHDMNAHYGSGWQSEVIRAFQTWADYANINLKVVSDNGQPFGSPGPLQGNPNFGDIRLAGLPISSDEVAIATPFDLFDSRSGDVVVSSNYTLTKGGANGTYDLYTAMLHEAGHVFGLDHSPDPASAMYEDYLGPKAGLSAGDVHNIQDLYGVRTPDAYEGLLGNNTPGTATPLALANVLTSLLTGTSPQGIQADLTTASDVDYYKVQANLSGLSVQLRTSDASLLTARVTVYDSSLRVVASATATDPLAGDLFVNVKGARAGATYYVKVEGAQDDEFGIGAYQIAAGGGGQQSLLPPLLGLLSVDGHLNDNLLLATTMLPKVAEVDDRWDDTTRASISDGGDVDYYRVVAPVSRVLGGLLTETPRDMVVTVQALEVGKLEPTVGVFDLLGRPMAFEVLANDTGNFTLQIANVSPLQVFYIRVAAANPSAAANNTGNYFLGVDFRSWVIQMDTFAAGTLTQAQPQAAYQLQNDSSQLYHFVLSANTNSTVAAAVRMTIYDVAGNVVRSVVAAAGQTASVDVMLAPGAYTVRFAAGTQNKAQALPTLTYQLTGEVRSDPIGPRRVDTTAAPADTSSSATTASASSPSAPPSSTTTSGDTTTTTKSSGTTTDTPPSSDSTSYTVTKSPPPPPADPVKDPYSDPYSDPKYTYSDPYSPA